MEKTIKGKFKGGLIEPLEKLELEEGKEVDIIVTIPPKAKDVLEALRSTVGAWKGTHDSEELKRNIYSDRLIRSRPEPRL